MAETEHQVDILHQHGHSVGGPRSAPARVHVRHLVFAVGASAGTVRDKRWPADVLTTTQEGDIRHERDLFIVQSAHRLGPSVVQPEKGVNTRGGISPKSSRPSNRRPPSP